VSKVKKTALTVSLVMLGLVAIVIFPYLLRGCENERLSKELRAEFDAWLASLPKIPDDQNGALVILQGLDNLEDLPVEYTLMKGDHLTEDGETAAVIREYLSRSEKALHQVEKGLEYPNWLYPTDYSKGFEALLPQVLNGMKGARAFSLRGNLARLDGNNAAAVNEYGEALRLGGTLSSDRWVVSRLVEMAIYKLALEGIMTMLSEGSVAVEELPGLLATLAGIYGNRGDYHSAMESERVTFFNAIADAIDGRKWSGGFLGQKPAFGLWKYFNWQAEVDTYNKFHDTCKEAHPAQFHSAPGILKNPTLGKFALELEGFSERWGSRPAVRMAACYVYWFKKCAEGESFWRAAIIMVALRIFEVKNGRLPENLDELGELVPEELLTDPFSGKQLVYKLKNGDFCLYSVGVDGVDGKCEDTRELLQIRADEGEPDDIIFHRPVKENQ
jgi:hypothetical protein